MSYLYNSLKEKKVCADVTDVIDKFENEFNESAKQLIAEELKSVAKDAILEFKQEKEKEGKITRDQIEKLLKFADLKKGFGG